MRRGGAERQEQRADVDEHALHRKTHSYSEDPYCHDVTGWCGEDSKSMNLWQFLLRPIGGGMSRPAPTGHNQRKADD